MFNTYLFCKYRNITFKDRDKLKKYVYINYDNNNDLLVI